MNADPGVAAPVIAPPVMLPYQRDWVNDESEVRVYEKSRRIGVSWATAGEAALLASRAKSAGGMDVWYIGYTKELALEFVRDAAMWARAYNLTASQIRQEALDDEDSSIKTFVIEFKSGFRITALSSSPRNLRGRQGYVIIDEAAFHDNLDELLKAALALLMWNANSKGKRRRGRIAIISTHDGVDNPFNQLIQDLRAKPRPDFAVHRTTFEEAMEQGLFKRMCLASEEEWTAEGEQAYREKIYAQFREVANEELHCIPRNSGGVYITRSVIDQCMYDAPVVRLVLDDDFALRSENYRRSWIEDWCEDYLAPLLAKLPPNPHAFGEDFGRSSNLTVIAPVTIEQALTRRVPFLVELGNVPYSEQEYVLFYIVDRLPRLLGGKLDMGVQGAFLAEQAALRYGERVQETAVNNAWYSSAFPRLKAALEDTQFLLPRDLDVLGDLRSIRVIKGVPKIPESPSRKGIVRHGDAAVALGLAWEASTMELEEYGYYPVRAGVDMHGRRLRDERERTVRVTHGLRSRSGGIL